MNEKKVILLVEDNPDILWANHAMFESLGFTVVTAKRLNEAKERLAETPPDVIVLDIMLPDGNSLDFMQEIRKLTSAPVLMLTALTEKDDRLAGLRAGGDDYITKPYDMDELTERVNAFLRRERIYRENPVKEIIIGPLRLDMISGRAYLNDEDLLLAPKEFLLLVLLARSEGKILASQYLYETVWNAPMLGDTQSVKKAISRLRAKLTGSGFIINAQRSEGYCLEKT